MQLGEVGRVGSQEAAALGEVRKRIEQFLVLRQAATLGQVGRGDFHRLQDAHVGPGTLGAGDKASVE